MVPVEEEVVVVVVVEVPIVYEVFILPRGYHPYTYSTSVTNSRAGSTHSSPSVLSIPLGSGDYG